MKAIFEILEEVAEAPTREKKREILKANDDLVLRNILRGSFDDSITWLLPKGPLPPEVVESKGERLDMYKEGSKLKLFVKYGPAHRMPQVERESKFFEMMNNIHPKDAEIIIMMKDKKLTGHYKGLTKKLVSDVWPNLILV